MQNCTRPIFFNNNLCWLKTIIPQQWITIPVSQFQWWHWFNIIIFQKRTFSQFPCVNIWLVKVGDPAGIELLVCLLLPMWITPWGQKSCMIRQNFFFQWFVSNKINLQCLLNKCGRTGLHLILKFSYMKGEILGTLTLPPQL